MFNGTLRSPAAIKAKLYWTAFTEPNKFLKLLQLKDQTEHAFGICEVYTKNIILALALKHKAGEFPLVLPKDVKEENLEGCSFLTRFAIDCKVKHVGYRTMTFKEAMSNPFSLWMPEEDEVPILENITKVVGVKYEIEE